MKARDFFHLEIDYMRLALLTLALIASSPALAKERAVSEAAETNQTASEAATEPKEAKKICKRLEETSTRLGGKKVCMTAAQWKRARQN
jgi:hypothetical protein